MFKLLEVKIEETKPTPLDILDRYYGRSTIVIKGENGKWYEVEDGHGADLVWIEAKETDGEMRRMVSTLCMENVTNIVIIEDAVEVWCDNEGGDQDQE